MSNLRTEIIDDVEGFDRLREEWRRLHAGTSPCHVFNSFAWSRTWWRHFGADHTLQIVTVRDDERLVALAPLGRSHIVGGPLAGRALQIIGTAAVPSRGMGLSDRADFIVEPDRTDLLNHLTDAIVSESDWDLLLLRGLPESSPTLEALKASLGKDRVVRRSRRRSNSFVLNLPASWEEFIGSKSAKWRKTHRAQINRADRSGKIEYRRFFPCTPEELDRVWAQIVEINSKSWKAERGTGLLQLDALQDFFREMTRAAAEEGLLDLTLASIDGKPFTYELYLSTQDSAGAYDGAYDQDQSNLSPGILITGFLIRDSIERGMRAFDFLRGDEPYKRRWGGEERHEIQFAAYRRYRPGALAAMAAIEGKQFLKKFSWLEELADKATGARVKHKMRRTDPS